MPTIPAYTINGFTRPELHLDSSGNIVLDPVATQFAATYGIRALYIGVPASTPYPPVPASLTTPSDANGSPNSVAEGAAAGTAVGITASATNTTGEPVIYSLTADSSHGGFAINPTTGVVTVTNPAKIDFESNPGHTYSITVEANDGILTSSQSFTIGVSNVAPTMPVDANAAANSVAEGAAVGTAVGITASSTDVNGPGVTWTLSTDSSGGGFAIDANGVITVADSSKIDYETAAGHAYTVTALASDGALTRSQVFTISVSDVPVSTPGDSDAAVNSVAEGAAAGTAVGVTASAVDPNGPASTYTLTGDTSGGGFTINSTTGVVTVADASKINFETAAGHAYTVTAQATNGAFTSSRTFTIAVTDVAPSAPTDANTAAANTVTEGAVNGTAVGITVSSTDINGPPPTYSLTDNAGGRFAIDAGTGIVTVANGAAIDFETATGHAYSIIAQASDGTLTSSHTFTIGVSDVAPSAPTDGNNAANTIVEGAGAGTLVGVTATSTDVNGPAVIYSFADIGGGVLGDAGGRFQIDSATGEVRVSAFGASNIDYESAAGHAYSVTVQASDGTLTSAPQTFSIAVTNVAPSTPADGDALTANAVTEGAAGGTYTGLTAASADINSGTVTYSLTDNAGGRFAIDSGTGAVSIAGPIDFESSGGSYSITVAASDGTNSTSQNFAIAVANTPPSIPTDSDAGTADVVTEGVASGVYIGLTAASTDINGPAVTWTLTDDAGGRFAIDPTSGAVSTGPNANLIDFETSGGTSAVNGSYSITAQASDGDGGTRSQTFAIAVADAPPASWSDGDGGANTILEGAANGTQVGVIAHAVDPNGGTVIYSLAANPNNAFAIDAASGIITVTDSTQINFESTAGHQYTLTVQATDASGHFTTNDFVVDVTDQAPSAPTDTDTTPVGGLTDGVIAEGAAQFSTVGITAHSLDVNGPAVTYSLSNDAGGLFTIDATSGVVSVTAAGATGIDYEGTVAAGHTYAITVEASDGTLSSSQNFVIGVTNAAPSQPTDFNGAAGGSIQANAADNTQVGITLASTDINGGAVTYSITDPSGAFAVDANTGVVTLKTLHPALTPAIYYTITAVVSDSTTTSAAQTFNIFVSNNALNVDLDGNDSGGVVGNSYAAAFTEQGSAVPITDTDDVITNTGNPGVTTATSATIVLTNAQVGDSLLVSGGLPAGISQNTTTGSGQITITLSGTASYANYQAALHQIQFSTSGDAPNTTPRVVNVTVTDPTGTSPVAVATIAVQSVNDAPVLTLGAASAVSYTENAGPTALFSTGSVSDPDNPASFNGGSFTVTITNPDLGGGDQIVLIGGSGFSASGNSILFGGNTIGTIDAGTGLGTPTVTIDLNSSATASVVSALAHAFGFQNSSDNPSTANRTVSFTFNDGNNSHTDASLALNSNVVTQTVNVIAVNDAPVVTATSLTSIAEDAANPSGATVTALFAGHFTDADNAAATISGIAVSGNTADASTEGVWQYSTDGGANWFAIGPVNASSALALSATSVLRFLPAADFNGTPPALKVHGLDDTFTTAGGTFTSGVTHHTTNATVNDGTTPVSANEVAIGTAVTEVNDAPVAIADTLSDIAEDSGAHAIAFSTLLANDSAGPANESGQTLTFTNVTNVFGGSVQIVGNDVIFTPTANFNGAASFDYTVQDNGTTNGGANPKSSATPGHVSFNITAVNDAPVNTVPFATQAIAKGAVNVAISGLSVSDVDGNGGTETTQLTTSHGNLHVTAGAAIISGGLNDSHTLTISGSTADISAALASLQYTPDAGFTGADTLTVLTNDGGHTGAPGAQQDTDTVAIQVSAPAAAGLDGQLWYVTRDAAASPVDDVVGHVNSDGTGIGFQNTTPTIYNDIGVDTAAGLYFTIDSSTFSLSSHLTSDGSVPLGGTQTPAGKTYTALAVDTVNHLIYVGVTGSTAAQTGIAIFTYDTAGALVNTGQFLLTQTSTTDATHTQGQYGHGTDFTIDLANHKLYYVDSDPNGVVTPPTNAVYVVTLPTFNSLAPSGTVENATPTLLTDPTHFPSNPATAGYLAIEAAAVDAAHHLVYFLTSDPANAGAGALWYIDTAAGTTAAQVTDGTNPIVLTGESAHTGLTFDPVSGDLFISNQGATAGSRVILQGHVDPVTHTIASFSHTYTETNLTGGTGTAVPGATTFDVLPTLAVDGGTFTEGTPAPLFNATLTVTDPEGYLRSASVVVTGGFAGDGDSLSFATAGTGISVTGGTADANGNLTLTLTGYDTAAHYQQVLQSIQFSSGDNPTNYGQNTSRTITWHLDDGAAGDPHSTGNTRTTTLLVTGTNDAPVAQAGSAIGNEDQSITGQAIATDVDNTPAQLTYGLDTGLNANGGATHGTVTISASGSYIYTPAAGFHGVDSFNFKANDGTLGSNDGLISITVNPVNHAPVVTATSLASVDEDTISPAGGSVASLFTGHFSDADNAAETISGIAVNGNTANSVTQGSWQYSTDSGTSWFAIGAASDASALALSAATLLRFLPALNFNGVPPALSAYGLDSTFANSGGTFTSGATTSSINASVNGGATAISDNATTISTSITSVNDAPVLDLNSADASGTTDFSANYTISATPVAIAPTTVYVTDVDDSNVNSATVTLTNAQSNDVLAINGALPGSISATITAGTVSLTGSATLSQYQTALHQIVFSNGIDGSSTVARNVTVVIDDGHTDNHASNIATTTINITADTAPFANAKIKDATEAGGVNNATAGLDPSGNVITDAPADTDNEDTPRGVALVVSAFGHGATPGTFGSALAGQYGTLTLNADGSYNYTVDNNNSTVQGLLAATPALTDVFDYTIRDSAGKTTSSTLTIRINGADDNPVAVADSPSATEAGTSAGVNPGGNVLTNDTDVDSAGNGETKAVVGVATGVQAGPLSTNVGSGVVSASNFGTLTIAADGTYSYVVNNANTSVQALRTFAQTLTDTFSYTMQDAAGARSTTQVTVTIHGQNDAPVANADTATATEAGGTNNGTAGTNISNFNVLTGVGTGSVADTDPDSAANGETRTVQGVETGTNTGHIVTSGVGSPLAGSFGTLTLNSNGSYSYTVDNSNGTVQALNNGGHVNDVFTYTMHDAAGVTSTTTLNIQVNGANDAPVGVADSAVVFQGRATTPSVNLLANDTDIDTAAANLTAVKDTNPAHGSVTVNANGSFTYTGNTGYLGADSFTYHVADNGSPNLSSASITVTLDVQPLVWHIDNTAAAGGDGSAAHPFNSIAAFNTANAAAGVHPDIVYLHTGTGTYTEADGINLNDGQSLLGQGVDLTYQTSASAPGGAHTVTLLDADNSIAPTIVTTAGDGIDLAQNNTVQGLHIGNTSGIGIADNGGTVGNLTISGVDINTNHQAVSFTHGGALNVTLNSITSTGGAAGIALGGALTGTFTGTTGTLSGHTTSEVAINGGSGTVSYGGTIGDGTGLSASIVNRTGGSVTLSGNINDGSDAGGGVSLSSNTGSTISFSGGMTLNTGASNAFSATGGGTVNVIGTSNSLTTTTGTALNVVNTTIGASELNFHDISSNGAPSGIILNATGTTGGLNVTGSGAASRDGSGGTITGSTGNGVSLTNTSQVSLQHMNINNSGTNGIFGSQVNGFVSDWNSLTGNGNAVNEGGIRFGGTLDTDPTGLTGGAIGSATETRIDHTVISGSYEHGLVVENTSGTLTQLNLTGTTIQNDLNGSGFLIETRGLAGSTAAATVQIAGSSFLANPGAGVQGNALRNTTLTMNILGNTAAGTNTFTGHDTILLSNGDTGHLVADIRNNTISGNGNGIFVGNAVSTDGQTSATLSARIVGNNITTNVGGANNSILSFMSGGTSHLLIDSNTVVNNGQSNGIRVATVDDNTGFPTGANFTAIVTNNTVTNGGSAANGISLSADTGSPAASTAVFKVEGNTVNWSAPSAANNLDGIFLNQFNTSTVALERGGTSGNNNAGQVLASNNPNAHAYGVGGAATTASGTITVVNNGTITLPLLAALGGVAAATPAQAASTGDYHLTQAELDSVVAAAIAQWAAAGASASQLAALHATTFSVADLSDNTVGEESLPSHITIDVDAAGHGWFVDPTPSNNSEFTHAANAAGTDLFTDPSNAAAGHLDLLTTVAHEMGHVLGLPDLTSAHDINDLMYIDLVDGERRLPGAGDVPVTSTTPLTPNIGAANAPVVMGTPGNDTIDAGHGGNILVGGAGADNFVFANVQVSVATPPPLTHVADYSFAQGDSFDFSALTSAFHGYGFSDTQIVRAVEDASGTFATLQVNANGPWSKLPSWVNVAQLDGAHAGDDVSVLIDSHAVHLAQVHVGLLV